MGRNNTDKSLQQTKQPLAQRVKKEVQRSWPMYVMLLPAIILALIFCYAPMGGLVMAFQNYKPWLGITGSEFVGLDNFKQIFEFKESYQAIINTFIIAVSKNGTRIDFSQIIVALLLNEVKGRRFKKVVQTIVYLPYFMSWVILGGIFRDMLSPGEGIINQIITAFGGKSIFFLGDNRYFRGTMIVTDIWKNFGYGAIVYLAAILGIDTQLYEAAQIDGANRWQQTWHVTLPGMKMIIVLMMVLSLGNVLNAGFDQIFNMYSTSVYQTGDIIDTFVYRLGLLDAQYGPATAVGLFKSVISTLFISVSYFLAYKLADYRIF